MYFINLQKRQRTYFLVVKKVNTCVNLHEDPDCPASDSDSDIAK